MSTVPPRHAVLITAYHDFRQLERLVARLERDFSVYVHIDRRSQITSAQELSLAMRFACRVFRVYRTGWGSSCIIDAVLMLAKRALEDPSIEYLHIVTGQDWPIGSAQRIYDYVAANSGMNWMSVAPGGSFRDRYEVRWFPDILNMQRPFPRLCSRIIAASQGLIGLKRARLGPFSDSEIYKGLLWCSLSRLAFEYVIEFNRNHPDFLRDLRTCKIPEEFFFQTILMNSRFRDKIVDDNKRLVIWAAKHGATPAILDEDDLSAIVQGDFLFARKFASGISDGLVRALEGFA